MVLGQVSSYPSWVIRNVVDSVRDTLEDNMSWASEMSENGRSRGGVAYIYIHIYILVPVHRACLGWRLQQFDSCLTSWNHLDSWHVLFLKVAVREKQMWRGRVVAGPWQGSTTWACLKIGFPQREWFIITFRIRNATTSGYTVYHTVYPSSRHTQIIPNIILARHIPEFPSKYAQYHGPMFNHPTLDIFFHTWNDPPSRASYS